MQHSFKAIFFGFCLLFATAVLANGERAQTVGRAVISFSLVEPATGKMWDFDTRMKGSRGLVIFFVATSCPVNNRYLPEMIELQKQFEVDGVRFVAVNSNRHDSVDSIEKHARDYRLTFPELHDEKGEIARQLKLTRTSEAILIDQRHRIRYRGRVDDRYERGVTRPKESRSDLRIAIQEMLNGKAVSIPVTEVEACPLELAPADAVGNTLAVGTVVEYARDLHRIIQNRCGSCHSPGGIGPFSLLSYSDAQANASSIREVVAQGVMPPWHADDDRGTFANDRSLTQMETQTVLNWIDGGCLSGDLTTIIDEPAVQTTWRAINADKVIRMAKSVSVPAAAPEGGVPYKYVWGNESFDNDTWVTAAEIHPGARSVVHHVIVYIVPKSIKVMIDNDQLQTGWLGELTSPLVDCQQLIAFVPGDDAYVHRDGLARRIPGGSRLLFELHYTPTGKPETDQTEVGIMILPTPPQHEVLGDAGINWSFRIPAGASRHPVTATYKAKRDMVLLSMNPHMHFRGKSFRYELEMPSGDRATLLNVPRYDFNWQSSYVLKEPKRIPKGSKIVMSAVFDNSRDNPWNPNPDVDVRWGEQTWEEMMLGYFEYYQE